jgi:putative oxidoreductase
MRTLARLQPYALALLRLLLGIAMVYHSWDKVYPPDGLPHAFRTHHLLAGPDHFNTFVASLGLPPWLGYISTVTEFVGGLCLIVGLLTRFWALMVIVNMLVALVTVNRHHGYTGSEFTLSLIASAFMLFTAGSGALSLDRRFGIS